MNAGDIDTIAKREHFVNMMMKNMTEMKIAVVGVGGAGNNVVSTVHSGCKNNVHTVAINTDEAALQKVSAHTKLLVGKDVTQGKGTNGFPEVGEYCGECAKEAIRESIKGKDLVFVIAGMGGGTGTGIAPIVTKISKESKAITFVIAINPFSFEKERSEKAKAGVHKLKTLHPQTVVVDNDTLLKSAENLPLNKAFGIIDRSVIKIIDSLCTQVNETFVDAFTSEVEGMLSARLPQATKTAEPHAVMKPMACEVPLPTAQPAMQPAMQLPLQK